MDSRVFTNTIFVKTQSEVLHSIGGLDTCMHKAKGKWYLIYSRIFKKAIYTDIESDIESIVDKEDDRNQLLSQYLTVLTLRKNILTQQTRLEYFSKLKQQRIENKNDANSLSDQEEKQSQIDSLNQQLKDIEEKSADMNQKMKENEKELEEKEKELEDYIKDSKKEMEDSMKELKI